MDRHYNDVSKSGDLDNPVISIRRGPNLGSQV